MIENISSIAQIAKISDIKDIIPENVKKDINDIADFDKMLQKLIDAENGVEDIAGNPFESIGQKADPFEPNGLDGSTLKQIIVDLAGAENANQASTNEIISGNINNLDGAMIDMNEMNIAVQFTMQVRNKVVEAYQEIMRMQM